MEDQKRPSIAPVSRHLAGQSRPLQPSTPFSSLFLARNERFIPYRSSKLTRLLQQALGGRELLRLLATVSPVDHTETLRTLEFASRARALQSYPKALDVSAEHVEAEELDAFARAVQALKIHRRRSSWAPSGSDAMPKSSSTPRRRRQEGNTTEEDTDLADDPRSPCGGTGWCPEVISTTYDMTT